MTILVDICSSTIRDKIIPHAVSWFTGEAVQGDDFEDIDDDEDEEEEDEEEDEDEGDEDDDDEDTGEDKGEKDSGKKVNSHINWHISVVLLGYAICMGRF